MTDPHKWRRLEAEVAAFRAREERADSIGYALCSKKEHRYFSGPKRVPCPICALDERDAIIQQLKDGKWTLRRREIEEPLQKRIAALEAELAEYKRHYGNDTK